MSNLKFMSINDLSEKEFIQYFYLCNSQKQEIIKKYFHEEDKYRSVCGEKLIRDLIADFENISIDQVLVSFNKYGKPYSPNSKLLYNISHSGSLVVIAYDYTPIGVDIEKIKNLDFDFIIKEFATDFEILQFQKSRYPKNHFYHLWTLKEAYFKCVGTGIKELKDVEFSIQDGNITSNKIGFSFETNLFGDDYIVSTCKRITP